jgi:hypothetical protein
MGCIGGWCPRRLRERFAKKCTPAEVLAMEDLLLVAGQVKPAVTIDLRAEASGIVEFRRRQGRRSGGGRARSWSELDSKLAQSSLDQAEANLRQPSSRTRRPGWTSTKDALEMRRRTYERNQKLYEQGLLPKDQLEQRELEYRAALRTVERAKRGIESSQARITQAKASVDQARTQLTKTDDPRAIRCVRASTAGRSRQRRCGRGQLRVRWQHPDDTR